MKILAVDDDCVALELLSLSLAYGGYDQVTLASSAQDALDIIETEREPFECMLLDIVMPEMDGVELCQRVRNISAYADIPIIMITAVNVRRELEAAIAAGATDYVNKPFDGLELGARLRAASMLLNASGPVSTQAAVSSDHTVHRLNSIKLGDPLQLDSAPGLFNQISYFLELEKAPLPPKTQICAIAIVEANDILKQVDPERYRSFLNSLAKETYHTLHRWSPIITYCGYGVFALVLRNSATESLPSIRKALQDGMSDRYFDDISNYHRTVQLRVIQSRLDVQDANESVLRRVSQHIDAARSAAQSELTCGSATTIRDTFLKGTDKCEEGSWKLRLAVPKLKKPTRIKPRRVLPKYKVTSDQESSLSKTTQLLPDQNIFSEI